MNAEELIELLTVRPYDGIYVKIGGLTGNSFYTKKEAQELLAKLLSVTYDLSLAINDIKETDV